MLAEIAEFDARAALVSSRASHQSRPVIVLRRVDLPAPLQPTTAILSSRLMTPGTPLKTGLKLAIFARPALGEPSHLDDVVAAARGDGKVELHRPFLGRNLDAFDLLELLDPRLHLRGVGRARGEAGNELFLLGKHVVLLLMRGQ